jgi:hypothetical protein
MHIKIPAPMVPAIHRPLSCHTFASQPRHFVLGIQLSASAWPHEHLHFIFDRNTLT